MSGYYNRKGERISLEQFYEILNDGDRIVKQETLPNGIRVSTVFLGSDHNYSDKGPPLIFETMVFPNMGWSELDMERYSTEAEAIEGHEKMVKKHA